jgi:hypothetical protein
MVQAATLAPAVAARGWLKNSREWLGAEEAGSEGWRNDKELRLQTVEGNG